MKNISSINLGGRVISIEDSAWQMYRAYIETLHRYFMNEEGCFEIINDIEGRVSKLMQEIINDRHGCINNMDIEHIIRVMGTADDHKELDNDDWDLSFSSAGNGISTAISVYAQSENTFSQPDQFELCSN